MISRSAIRRKFVSEKSLSIFLTIGIIMMYAYVHKPHWQMDVQGKHAWRQSQTMWNINNYARYDANFLNPRVASFNGGKDNILRYEMPFFQWVAGMSIKIFGDHILVVRILVFCITILGLTGLWGIISQLTGNYIAGSIASGLYLFSPIMYYYGIMPLPDLTALSFSLLYLWAIFKWKKAPSNSMLAIIVCTGIIGVGSKLPFALMLSAGGMLALEASLTRAWNSAWWKFVVGHMIIVLPVLAWYGWVIPTWTGNPVITDAGGFNPFRGETLQMLKYNMGQILPNVLLGYPSWLFGVIGLGFLLWHFKKFSFVLVLFIMALAFYLLEIKPIGYVHDYYLMPFVPALFIAVGLGVHSISKLHKTYMIIGIVALALAIPNAMNITHHDWQPDGASTNLDLYNYKDQLRNAAPQNALCIIINDHTNYIFSYMIDKRGHIFSNDQLPIPWIADMIDNHNVTYMYSDSDVVNSDPDLMPHIDSMVLQAGSIKVFKLRAPQ